MKFINELLKFFAYITTGTAIAFVIYTAVIKVETVPVIMIAEIPIAGFIMALITTAMLCLYKVQNTKKGLVLIAFLHFALTSAGMVGLGVAFEWMNFEIKHILLMLLCVAFVWLFAFLLFYLNLKREADEINDALNEKSDVTE